MKRWNHSLLLLALGVPGLAGSLIALHQRGAELWLLVLTLGAMIISCPGIFLAGLMSLFGTQTFLRKAASAKGYVSDITEVTPTWASDYLFPGRKCATRRQEGWSSKSVHSEDKHKSERNDSSTKERTKQWYNSTNQTWSSAWSNLESR
jgi:hypothetical protein